MALSQLSNRAIVALCFTAGGAGIGSGDGCGGASTLCERGSPVGTDVVVLTGSRLDCPSVGILSRWEAGTSSGEPVMRRLMERASSSDGLAFSIARHDDNPSSVLPSA